MTDPDQPISPVKSPVKRPSFRARSPFGDIPIKTSSRTALDKDKRAQSTRSAMSGRATEEQSDSADADFEDDGSYLAACGVSPNTAGTSMALVRSGSNYRKPAVSDA